MFRHDTPEITLANGHSPACVAHLGWASDRPSAEGLLAVAGLQMQANDPPTGFADPRLETVCREAAKRGLVITDAQGRLVGDLRAVSVADIPSQECGRALMSRAPSPTWLMRVIGRGYLEFLG